MRFRRWKSQQIGSVEDEVSNEDKKLLAFR